jgi:hypothetical protein
MSGGGIIIQRAKEVLVSATSACWYQNMYPAQKQIIDAIDAKDPMTRTVADIAAILEAMRCANV